MSSVPARLLAILTNKFPRIKPQSSTSTTNNEHELKNLVGNIKTNNKLPTTKVQSSTTNNDDKHRKLVENFKRKSSESYRFRNNKHRFNHVVRRLASAKKFSLIDDILQHQKQYVTTEGFAVRLLKLYGKAGMFDHAHKLFDELPELNCQRSVKSFNALLSACIESKSFNKFEEVFQEVSERVKVKPDLVSYNIRAKGCCDKGDLDSAMRVLDELEESGIEPNLVTFNTLLEGFYKKRRFSDGERIWKMMESKSVQPDILSLNSRLRGMVREQRMQEAVEFVEVICSKGINLDVYSYNALIRGFCMQGNMEEVKRWYGEMKKNSCSPDMYTVTTLVPFLCQSGDFDMGVEVCIEAINRGVRVGSAFLQSVVDDLCRESRVQEAQDLVELVRCSEHIHYDLVLPCNEEKLQEFVETFKKKSSASIRFRNNNGQYNYMVRHLASLKEFSLIDDILQHQKQYISSEGFASRLLKLYGKAGMFDQAQKLFDQLPELNCQRTLKSFNALLSACVISKSFDKLDEVFRRVSKRVNVKPDLVSYNIRVKAFCDMGDMDSAIRVLDELDESSMEADLVTFNTLLHGFYKSGRFSEGERIWKMMESKSIEPDIISYNSRLRGMVHDQRMQQAVELVDVMQIEGVNLDVHSYNALIGRFCDQGNIEEVKRWYSDMKKNSCSPDGSTIATLVPFFLKNGDFDMALEVCIQAINQGIRVGSDVLQSVVEVLCRESRLQDAENLVKIARRSKRIHYDLVSPVNEYLRSEGWISRGDDFASTEEEEEPHSLAD